MNKKLHQLGVVLATAVIANGLFAQISQSPHAAAGLAHEHPKFVSVTTHYLFDDDLEVTWTAEENPKVKMTVDDPS